MDWQTSKIRRFLSLHSFRFSILKVCGAGTQKAIRVWAELSSARERFKNPFVRLVFKDFSFHWNGISLFLERKKYLQMILGVRKKCLKTLLHFKMKACTRAKENYWILSIRYVGENKNNITKTLSVRIPNGNISVNISNITLDDFKSRQVISTVRDNTFKCGRCVWRNKSDQREGAWGTSQCDTDFIEVKTKKKWLVFRTNVWKDYIPVTLILIARM